MNWIKQNAFLSGLIGGTLLICGLLTFVAMKGGSKYENAKSEFTDAYTDVTKSEKLSLYPTAENRQAKIKALDDYSHSIDQLREFYSKYQLDPAANITTQQLTGHVVAAKKEVEAAFTAADSKLPADFFMGFEAYSNQLANSGSTVLLDYQVNAIKHLLLGMAEARPSSLIRIYRKKIPEESDKPYEPVENEVARKFSYEIVFKGSEASVREFLAKLGEKDSYYYVIRSMRINNEKDTPPKVTDAKFEKPAPAVNDANPFGAGFFQEDPAPAGGAAKPPVAPQPVPEGVVPQVVEGEEGKAPTPSVVPPAPIVPPAPPVAASDSSRILYQVLGDEELEVFVRFDVLLFSPQKETTKH